MSGLHAQLRLGDERHIPGTPLRRLVIDAASLCCNLALAEKLTGSPGIALNPVCGLSAFGASPAASGDLANFPFPSPFSDDSDSDVSPSCSGSGNTC